MNRIPSDEDFERVSKEMELQFLNLDVVQTNVAAKLRQICPVHDFHILPFHILPQGDDGFRAYVFFKENKEVEEFLKSSILHELKDIVFEELEKAHRGKRNEIRVAFEFDSDENVQANFEGDYFLRLR